MPSKSLPAANEIDEIDETETNIFLGDSNGTSTGNSNDFDIVTKQDGGAKDSKKIQIKKKEPISAARDISSSKPSIKMIKKKVSITEEPNVKELDKELEQSLSKKDDKKEDKKEDKLLEQSLSKKDEKKDEKKDDKKEVLVDVNKALKASKKPSKKQDVSEFLNDDDVDYRYIITNYDFSKNKTLPRITRYEKALLVGKRATQIEEGANPNVKVLPGQTSIDIAEEELRQRTIPFIIKRPIGNKFEYWKPSDMEVIMD